MEHDLPRKPERIDTVKFYVVCYVLSFSNGLIYSLVYLLFNEFKARLPQRKQLAHIQILLHSIHMNCIFFFSILVMDFLNSAQDVVRCTLCQNPEDLMYCEVCYISLCKDCAEKYTFVSENHTAVTH